MTTIATQISAQIANTKCSRFRFIEGGTLILYFTFDDSDTSNKRLWIDCAWRLRKGKSVEVGSMDESAIILQVLREIEGRAVECVSVDDDTGDIRLSLSADLLFETFGYATVDEHWEFRRSDGLRFGVGPQYEPFERYDDPDEMPQRV